MLPPLPPLFQLTAPDGGGMGGGGIASSKPCSPRGPPAWFSCTQIWGPSAAMRSNRSLYAGRLAAWPQGVAVPLWDAACTRAVRAYAHSGRTEAPLPYSVQRAPLAPRGRLHPLLPRAPGLARRRPLARGRRHGAAPGGRRGRRGASQLGRPGAAQRRRGVRDLQAGERREGTCEPLTEPTTEPMTLFMGLPLRFERCSASSCVWPRFTSWLRSL